MIKKYDGKIGFRELITLIIICLGMKVTDSTPVLLTKLGLNSSWMLPIISGLVIIIPILCLLSLLKLYSDKNIIDIIYLLTGKVIGLILVFLLLILTLQYVIITIRSYSDILNTLFYIKTPIYVITLLLIVSSCYIANKGFSVIGSLSWIIYFSLQGILLILVIMLWKEFNFSYLFPLGGPGVFTLLKEGTTHSTILGEFIILAVFFPLVRSFKDYRNATLLGFLIAALQLSIFMIIYISVYGYPTLSVLNYPYHQLTRLVNVGRFATNMEAIFLGFWVLGTSIRFSLYFSTASTILSNIIKCKNQKLVMVLIGISTFLMSIVPDNFTKYVLDYREFTIVMFWIYVVGLPILLYVIAKLKGEYKR